MFNALNGIVRKKIVYVYIYIYIFSCFFLDHKTENWSQSFCQGFQRTGKGQQEVCTVFFTYNLYSMFIHLQDNMLLQFKKASFQYAFFFFFLELIYDCGTPWRLTYKGYNRWLAPVWMTAQVVCALNFHLWATSCSHRALYTLWQVTSGHSYRWLSSQPANHNS